jgi:hypothetical protein
MVTVAFHANQLGLYDTGVILYDYARLNELLLNNRSIIVIPAHSPHESPAVERLKQRFPVFTYYRPDELEVVLAREQCLLFYCLKYGFNDNLVSGKIKTIVHCTSDLSQPHGDVYAAASEFISRKFGGRYPVVPHVVELASIEDSLRPELGIPEHAIVFGQYGGNDAFDLDFVKQTIEHVADEQPNMFFIFMNIPPFVRRRNVRFLRGTIDPKTKAKFINTCDAMIHAQSMGETFGLICGEFSVRNRPVITNITGAATGHCEILGEKGIYYSNGQELYNILTAFIPEPDKDWDAYSRRFNAYAVMDKFRQVFLEPFGFGNLTPTIEKRQSPLFSAPVPGNVQRPSWKNQQR